MGHNNVSADRLPGSWDVQTFKGCLGIGDRLFVEAGKQVRPSLQENDAPIFRASVQRARKFSDRPSEF